MKSFATVVLVLVVIVASLICLLLSMCAVGGGLNGGGPNGGDRAVFAGCALVSLAVAVGGVMLIGKINRKV